MNVDDGFEAQLRGTQKRRVLVAVAGGVGVLVLLCVGLLVSALGHTSAAPAPAANPDHRAMLKASIRAQRSALSSRPAAVSPAEQPAPVARAAPAAKPAPVAKAPKARKSSGAHAAAAEASDLKRPASIADPVGPPPAKTVASATSTGGSRGDEPADPN